jgi:multiple sugar transport system permease protein
MSATAPAGELDPGRVRPARQSRYPRLERRQRRAGYLLCAPAVAHMVLFTLIPVLAALWLSFTDYRVLTPPSWVGLDNYVTMFQDQAFRRSIWNTTVYTFFTVPFAMVLALLVAVALNEKLRARAWYRAAFFLPHVTATVAVAMVWIWMYNPRIGLFNAALGVFGIGRINWLGDPNFALPSVIVMGIWQGIGVKMLIYLAALQGIAEHLYEAAAIDGANKWQQFIYITVPQLKYATFFVFVISLIDSFQVFDSIWVMTQGGPVNSTTVMTYEVYRSAFQSFRMGYASAQAVLLFAIIFVLTVVSKRLTRSDDV